MIQHFCQNVDLIARPAAGDVKRISQNDLTNVAACLRRNPNVDIVERISYQPASHFWYVQAVESLLFVGVAAALVTLAILAVTRRRVF